MSVGQISAADATAFGVNVGNGVNDARKIRESAVEFEALLVGQVLEKLQHAFAPADDQNADPARDTVSSLGTHAVAQLLAQRHAFGIAEMLQGAISTANREDAIEGSRK